MTPVKIRVDPARVLGEVPRAIYGHFTENLATIVYDGIWAEMLYGRKFEAPMVHRVRQPIATPWEPFAGRTDGVAFRRAPLALGRYASPHAGAHHSQSIDLLDGHDSSERGLAQPEIRIEDGVEYTFRARLRRKGHIDRLRVALRAADGVTVLGEQTVALPEIARTRPGFIDDPIRIWMDDLSWSDVLCTLRASGSDESGHLTLTVEGGPGTVWLDHTSLMASDHLDGLDPRVADAFRDLRMPMLKWPGGCMADDYDWRLGIGPRDDRYGSMDQAWCAWDENDVGTEEFLRLCDLVGAEPFLCVNAGSGTPELAADWVRHCDGRVKYWCVGNEQWGWFERGYVGAKGYAERYLAFADAMRAVDPSIVLVAVGQPGDFDREVLEIAGDHIDMLSIHHYTEEVEPGDADDATRKILSARAYAEVFAQVRADIGDRDVRVAFDEWGFARETHAGAIYAAWALVEQHRAAPLVGIGGRSCAINVDGLVTREGTELRREPVFQTYALMLDSHRNVAVACETENELVCASALVDADGLSVFVVNAGAEAVALELAGLPDGTYARDELVAGSDGPWGPTEHRSGSDPTAPLAPHSLTVIRS